MNQEDARQIVHRWVVANGDLDPTARFDLEDVYVVWWSKTLQNSKALISTTRDDGMYYELTSNGDKGEIYFDAYKKVVNHVISATVQKAPTVSAGPHSRTCKIKPHAHGNECHSTCPTCHGLARF